MDNKEVTIQASVDRSTLTIGDHIQYQVTVTHKPQVKMLDLQELKTADLKILSKKDLPPQTAKGVVIRSRTYVLTTYDTGPRTIPAIQVNYLDSAGNKAIAASNEVPLTVKSVLSGADHRTDIRDVKGVTGILPQYQKYVPFVWGTLGILVLAVIIWLFRSKFKKIFFPVDYLLNPYEEAVKKLERLTHSLPSNQQKVKPFYLELSRVVRHYLERNFGIRAEELTTHELAERLNRLELAQETREKLIEFLESCDLVKFSQFLPPESDIREDVEKGKVVVELCQPKIPDPVPEAK